MATVAQVALSDLTWILHELAGRVRLHSESEAEGLHDAISSLDPEWTKPKPVMAPAQTLTGPDGSPVSPQAWASFLAHQANEQAKAAAAAAQAADAAPTVQAQAAAAGVPTEAPALTAQQVAQLAAQHGLQVSQPPPPPQPEAPAALTTEQVIALAAQHGLTTMTPSGDPVEPDADDGATAVPTGGEAPPAP